MNESTSLALIFALGDSTLAAATRKAASDPDVAESILAHVSLVNAMESGVLSVVARTVDPRETTTPRARRPGKAVPATTEKASARPARKATETVPKAAKTPGAPKAKGEKRAPAMMAQLVDAVQSHIRANPGEGVEQIGKAIGQKTKDLQLPIRKLVDDKRIHSTGKKRATRYFPGAAE